MLTYPINSVNIIREVLISSRRTIAVAESVTAGLLQNALSQATDARLFFQGGITVYNVAQKCRQLHVEPIQAEKDNGVSTDVAIQLATQVARAFCSQVGTAIVGYAAPVPEKGINSTFAYYAIVIDGQLVDHNQIIADKSNPLDNQLHYVFHVLDALCRTLGG